MLSRRETDYQLYKMGDVSVELAPFEGKELDVLWLTHLQFTDEEDFDMWTHRFKAFLGLKGLRGALDPVDGQVTPEMIEANRRAFNYLVLSMGSNKGLRVVVTAKTENYPEGDASEAWERLREKLEAAEFTTLNAFLHSKMGVSEDPESFIDKKRGAEMEVE